MNIYTYMFLKQEKHENDDFKEIKLGTLAKMRQDNRWEPFILQSVQLLNDGQMSE